MMHEVFYRQCELVKGSRVQVAWIPEQYAILDKYVELRDHPGWSNGWRITYVSSIRISEWERQQAGARPDLPSIL